jgi:DeoR/GlpR family transcriptional regulator of sugar metabolism
MMAKSREKEALARVALSHVEPGMSLLLDDSTTTFQMVEGLAEKAPLHVATNFVTGMRKLTELGVGSDITIIGIGGVYDAPHDSFGGIQCIEQIEGLRADALFLSTSAVSETDAFHQADWMVSLKRAMIRAATKRYLLVDHSKLGQVALHRITPLDVFDLIITDAGADPRVLAAWDHAGIKYELAP